MITEEQQKAIDGVKKFMRDTVGKEHVSLIDQIVYAGFLDAKHQCLQIVEAFMDKNEDNTRLLDICEEIHKIN